MPQLCGITIIIAKVLFCLMRLRKYVTAPLFCLQRFTPLAGHQDEYPACKTSSLWQSQEFSYGDLSCWGPGLTRLTIENRLQTLWWDGLPYLDHNVHLLLLFVAMKPHEIQEKLGLTRIRDRNWYVQPSCATTGDGLYEGLTWLTSNIKTWHATADTQTMRICSTS